MIYSSYHNTDITRLQYCNIRAEEEHNIAVAGPIAAIAAPAPPAHHPTTGVGSQHTAWFSAYNLERDNN